ncbi:MAG: hypothetical protein IPH44_17085 [Myxococcales bacterium]|jgi:hypothetical protein|nr:hypothetical protein [Myxococcales bacterium]MBK7196525.1 hypothetical protein [Myxococcales bacterium]MBP6845729.1 hypothetical protein [Kofleriaceae bacterium]
MNSCLKYVRGHARAPDAPFGAWLRATYDNDVPVAAFVWVGPTSDLAVRARSIARARRWLAGLDAAGPTPEG